MRRWTVLAVLLLAGSSICTAAAETPAEPAVRDSVSVERPRFPTTPT